VSSQTGTSAVDRVVTSSMCEIEMGLAQSTLERLAEVQQGFELVSVGGSVVGFAFSPSIGERDSSITQEMTLTRITDGIASTDPLDIVTVFQCAPSGSAELTYDSSSQRFYTVSFKCYRSTTILSPTGKPMFFGGGQFVA
jgi:hypothetical protein